MRLLVTGASGFVGRRLVQAAVAAGHTVGALRRSAAAGDPGLPPPVEVLHAPFDDVDGLAAVVSGWETDAAVHLAWYAEPGTYLDSVENVACLRQGLTLVEALTGSARAVVMVGTCAEYDTDAGFLVEGAPTRPSTLYAACKLALGHVALQRSRQRGVPLAWARLFQLYGPGEDARRLVPSAVLSLADGRRFAATPGTQVRDYLHVDDVARGVLTLAETRATGLYNVASAEPLAVRTLLERLAETMGRPGEVDFGARPGRAWEPPFICGDNRRLRDLGWHPRHTLASGLEDTVGWWRGRGQAP